MPRSIMRLPRERGYHIKRSHLLLLFLGELYFLAACGGSSSADTATHLSVAAPAIATAGIAFQVNVTALDAANHAVTGYSGVVHFSSSDDRAVLPADSTLRNGTGIFSTTLRTTGPQTIKVADSVTTSITGVSSAIAVSGPATHFAVSGPGTARSGADLTFTVTALDATNHVAGNYPGSVHFSSTDNRAALPPNSTLKNGTGTFSATLLTVGSQTITGSDTTAADISGTSNSILVYANCATARMPCYAAHPCCPGLVCVAGGDRDYCAPAPAGTAVAPRALLGFAGRATAAAGAREPRIGALLSSLLSIKSGADPTTEHVNSVAHGSALTADIGKAHTGRAVMIAPSAAAVAGGISFETIDISGANDYFVSGINDAGVVVGSSSTDAGNTFTGFIRLPTGRTTSGLLDPNDSGVFTVLHSINNRDVIAGSYGGITSSGHGLLLSDGEFTTFDIAGAAGGTTLRGINNRGDLAGTFSRAAINLNADQFGFIAPEVGAPVIFRLPDSAGDGLVVEAINNRRAVVGYFTAPNSTLIGFVREPDGDWVNIAVSGADATLAYGINNCGVVAGYYVVGDAPHGFYGRPGSLRTLHLPGAIVTRARGINNKGQIVGDYVDASGLRHGYVTAPIAPAACPE